MPKSPLVTEMEAKFLYALNCRTMMQSGFIKEVGDPGIATIVQKIRDAGVAVQMAIIDESTPGQPCPQLAFFYLEEDDVWTVVGENVNVTFPRMPLKPILRVKLPKRVALDAQSTPAKSAWDEAANEVLEADACLALLAKLRNQRP